MRAAHAAMDRTADTIILNIDHYTLLRQALLNVKGVPMRTADPLLPDERRGTRHRIPDSHLRHLDDSRTVHSQRVLLGNQPQPGRNLFYDWFSKAGNGTGGEYRYNMGRGNDGRLTMYSLDQKATTLTNSDGSTSACVGQAAASTPTAVPARHCRTTSAPAHRSTT